MKKKYFYRFIKRIFDILCSLVGMVFLIPLTILVKLCYVFTGDFKPIFLVQDRIGKDGKLIRFYKYRSMVWDAEEQLKEILENPKHKKEWKKYKKLTNDPRITGIGKFLRKTSLDEFPQFLNVFVGNMSLIGPRPYLPREKKDMGKAYDEIIKIKPGVTGLWQINGRADTPFKERLVLDKRYVKEFGFILDFKIFLKTFVVVLFGKGAS